MRFVPLTINYMVVSPYTIYTLIISIFYFFVFGVCIIIVRCQNITYSDNNKYTNMSIDLLNEYVEICNGIQDIWNVINEFKQSFISKLNKCKSNEERDRIEKMFKHKLILIRNNNNITTKYKLLKKRKQEIQNILLYNQTKYNNINDINEDTMLDDLTEKYNHSQKKECYELLEIVKSKLS